MFSVHTKTQSSSLKSAFEKLRFLDVSVEIKVRLKISGAWLVGCGTLDAGRGMRVKMPDSI